jgi:hypothetical protein
LDEMVSFLSFFFDFLFFVLQTLRNNWRFITMDAVMIVKCHIVMHYYGVFIQIRWGEQ